MKKKIIVFLIVVIAVVFSISAFAYGEKIDSNVFDYLTSYNSQTQTLTDVPMYIGIPSCKVENSFLLSSSNILTRSDVKYIVFTVILGNADLSYAYNCNLNFYSLGSSYTYSLQVSFDGSGGILISGFSNYFNTSVSGPIQAYTYTEADAVSVALNVDYLWSQMCQACNVSDFDFFCISYAGDSVSLTSNSALVFGVSRDNSSCSLPHITDANKDGYDDSSFEAGVQAGKNVYGKVDANGDGYDDPSYTAGYNAGLSAGGASSSGSACTINHAWIGDDNIAIDSGEVDGIVKNGVCTCWLKGYVNGLRSIRDYGTLPKIVTDHVPDIADTGFKKGYDTGLLKAVEIYGTDENGDGYLDASYNAGYTAGASSSTLYNEGFDAGKKWQKNNDESTGAVSDFVTDVGGTVVSSFLYFGKNVEFLGISLLSLLGVLVVGFVVFFIFRKVKGG